MKKESLKKYDITQCALYKCRSKKRLKDLLKITGDTLKQIQNIISYRSFEISKNGTNEKRNITAPNPILKQIQTRILYLLQNIERPCWLISGEKGRCYIDNGKAHQLSNYVLTIDIKKFYDNCKREPVYQFFVNYLKTSNDVAKILTDVVTYNQGIPTGCPTSQLIAYYSYQDMFEEINTLSQAYGCKFTLYVDDMTFSNIFSFKQKSLANEVDKVLRKYGHKPKYCKIKYYSKHDPKPITGTIIMPNHQLEVPNNLQKKVYDNFQIIKDVDISSPYSFEYEKMLLSLKGQLQAVKNINPKKFPEITRLTNKIPVSMQSKKMDKTTLIT